MKIATNPLDSSKTALVNARGQIYVPAKSIYDHEARVKNQLQSLGMSKYALMRAESKYLPKLIHHDENIGGVAYGHYQGGFAMLVATDRRVIFLDKKPMTTIEDDITYFVVSGVSITNSGFDSTVCLHTRIKDYTLRTMNQKCAETFVRYIEERCIEQRVREEIRYDYGNQNRPL